MDTLEKDKISNNSSNVSSTEDESSSIVTTVQFKDQTLYCCAKIREKHFLYLWVSSQAGIQMILKFLENHYIGKEMQFFLECSTFSETFFRKCPEVRMSDTMHCNIKNEN